MEPYMSKATTFWESNNITKSMSTARYLTLLEQSLPAGCDLLDDHLVIDTSTSPQPRASTMYDALSPYADDDAIGGEVRISHQALSYDQVMRLQWLCAVNPMLSINLPLETSSKQTACLNLSLCIHLIRHFGWFTIFLPESIRSRIYSTRHSCFDCFSHLDLGSCSPHYPALSALGCWRALPWSRLPHVLYCAGLST